jgi:hypothetical protein
MKEKLGLPDPRLREQAQSKRPVPAGVDAPYLHANDIEQLIASITSQVLAFLKVTQ